MPDTISQLRRPSTEKRIETYSEEDEGAEAELIHHRRSDLTNDEVVHLYHREASEPKQCTAQG